MMTFEKFMMDFILYDLKCTLIDDKMDLRTVFHYANGCGAKNGIKVPPTIWFANIEAACIIHDIEWQLSKNYNDLVFANENFDDNLKIICDKESNSFTSWFRRMRIAKYVSAVELIGTANYADERGFDVIDF